MEQEDINKVCDVVRETSYSIHQHLRHGYLEKIYENALVHRLSMQGLQVEQQVPFSVKDEDDYVLGEYFADLFIENILLVELKAVDAIHNEHIAQLLGYLRATRIEHGLIINFGASKLQIRKFILTPTSKPQRDF